MYRDCCVALPRDDMGLSAVCDCGISLSYSLTIFEISMDCMVLWSFNGLAGLCISVGCVRLAVPWRFCRLVVSQCFKDLCVYTIFESNSY